ncbi:hypothetical protein CY35_19G040700 [Sphagnum magellanicum]|nr:hypothetical protein CY35_19G040700 [Sphagnum magellanicum]
MGDSRIAEELVQLLREVSASLTLKLSHFISLLSRYNNKNTSSSVGAAAAAAATAAGVTLALLFCTWRYWRMPRRISSSRRRRSNRSSRGPSNQSNKREEEEEEGSPLSSSSSLSSLEMEGSSTAVARAMTQAAKRGSNSTSAEGGGGDCIVPKKLPSLMKSVRQQLKGGRKMTCQLLGVILQESTAEELQKHAVVRPQVVQVLLEIAGACDLYLMARVMDDASEELVLAALDCVGFFTVPGTNRNKVLFCSTEAGRSSFVRQLEPDWHVDILQDTIAGLAPFVPHQLHIASSSSSGAASAIASNVFLANSLELFFGFPGAHTYNPS